MTMTEQQQNAVNFLLFSYFGVTLNSTTDDIIDACVNRAYKDATIQRAFNFAVGKNKKNEEAKKAFECCKNIIIKDINELINNSVTYDTWHNSICNNILECYETNNLEKEFVYGNAQKWVNMTLKYLYLLDSIFEEQSAYHNEIGGKISSISDKLHIPVDSYIIKKLWENEDVELPISTLKRGSKKGERGDYSESRVISWSNWTYKEYKDFIDSIENCKTLEGKDPIDWEGPAWIEIAQEKAQK